MEVSLPFYASIHNLEVIRGKAFSVTAVFSFTKRNCLQTLPRCLKKSRTLIWNWCFCSTKRIRLFEVVLLVEPQNIWTKISVWFQSTKRKVSNWFIQNSFHCRKHSDPNLEFFAVWSNCPPKAALNFEVEKDFLFCKIMLRSDCSNSGYKIYVWRIK